MTTMSTRKNYVLDTNIFMHDANALFKFAEHNIIIPITVLEELEAHKKDAREVGRNTRHSLNNLDRLAEDGLIGTGKSINQSGGTLEICVEEDQFKTMLPMAFTWELADNRIMAVTEAFNATLVTKDTALRIKARSAGIPVENYKHDQVDVSEMYTGHRKGYLTEEDLDKLYEQGYIEAAAEKFIDPEVVTYPNMCVTFMSLDNVKHSAVARFDAGLGIFCCISGSILKPAGLQARNQEQLSAFDLLLNPDIALVTLVGKAGCGKAQPLDSLVLTPTGYVEMWSLKVGDSVMCPDGNSSLIQGIFPQGEKDIYKVTFSDGSSTECCDEHLWNVKSVQDRNYKRDYRTLPLSELRKEIIKSPDGKSPKRNWSIPVVGQSINFTSDVPLPLDPYLLGLLLGDGGITAYVGFTTADQFIQDKCDSLLEQYGCKLVKKIGDNYDYYIQQISYDRRNGCKFNLTTPDGITTTYKYIKDVTDSGFSMHSAYRSSSNLTKDIQGNSWERVPKDFISANKVKNNLCNLGLFGKKSDNKFIPKEYLYTSVENRIELLRGLMDTDGFVDARGVSVEFYSISKELAYGVKFLVESLGGLVTLSIKDTHYIDKGGNKVVCQPCYRLYLRLPPSINPFNLPRKRDRYTPKTKYVPTRFIENVELVGKKEAQCILIDNPNHLYITNNFIVTHNTLVSLAAAMQMVLEEGLYDKILVARPVVPMGNDVGYLPGDINEKMAIWMNPIKDNVEFLLNLSVATELKKIDKDADKAKKVAKKVSAKATVAKEYNDISYAKDFAKIPGMDELLASGKMEIAPLTFIRGRSLPRQLLICDESQSLSPHEIKTIITRMGEGSKIIFTGDIEQIDAPYLDASSNGLSYIVEKFKSEKIAAHITLEKCERSELADIASRIL